MANVSAEATCPIKGTDGRVCDLSATTYCGTNNWDARVQIAYDLIRDKMLVCRKLLEEMNRDWREPVCKCSEVMRHYRTTVGLKCGQCGRPTTRPRTAFATAWMAYENVVRTAEEALKLLIIITAPTGIPDDNVLKKPGHDLQECWNRLPHCTRTLLDNGFWRRTNPTGPKISTVVQGFDQQEFHTVRYAWTNFDEKLPKIKSDLQDLYRVHECTHSLLWFIEEMFDSTPRRERSHLTINDPDYHHPEWPPKPQQITKSVRLRDRYDPHQQPVQEGTYGQN